MILFFFNNKNFFFLKISYQWNSFCKLFLFKRISNNSACIYKKKKKQNTIIYSIDLKALIKVKLAKFNQNIMNLLKYIFI